MNLSVKELQPSNKREYEAFIARKEHAEHLMFFHSWEWGEFMRATAPKFVRVGIYKKDTLVATAQVGLAKSKFCNYWYCPRGMVVDYRDKKLATASHTALAEYFRNMDGAGFLRVDPNILHDDSTISVLDSAGAKKAGLFVQAQRVWMADIQNSEEAQLAWLREHGMRKSLPSMYRKGLREGITIRAGDKAEDIELFVSLLEKLHHRKGGIGKRDDEYYKTQFAHMAVKGYEKIFVAEYKGQVLAVSLFALYGHEASYLHGASTDIERNMGGPHVLHLQTMAYLAQHYPHITHYNFWGIVSEKNRKPGNPHHGYSEFKRSFGGYEVLYADPRDFVYSWPRWVLTWALETYRRIKSKKD